MLSWPGGGHATSQQWRQHRYGCSPTTHAGPDSCHTEQEAPDATAARSLPESGHTQSDLGEASKLVMRRVCGQERLTPGVSVASTRWNMICVGKVRQGLIKLLEDRRRRLHVRDKRGGWKPSPDDLV